mmetsp:Transcript_60485/g.107841  ORF Transcript_60485/g.107841 Transcript_60485/m.107841 type:complete len:272 (+) Transcript_60485:1263-2078(+)
MVICAPQVEGVCRTFSAWTASPPDAVDVVLIVVRALVVDHQLQRADVQPSGDNGGGDHHRLALLFVLIQGVLPVVLVHTAVHHAQVHCIPGTVQVLVQVVTLLLRVNKDQDEPLLHPLAQQLQQPEEFFIICVEELHVLCNCVARRAAPTHDNLNWVLQPLLGGRLDGFGEGGGDHDRLAVWAGVLTDFGHLRPEAHIEHAVRLVKDEVRDTAQARDAPLVGDQHVDHAAGRGADDVGRLLEVRDLLRDRGAAIAAGGAQPQGLGELLDLR